MTENDALDVNFSKISFTNQDANSEFKEFKSKSLIDSPPKPLL